MELFNNDKNIKKIEDLIFNLEIDLSRIKLDILKFQFECYENFKKIEDYENKMHELKRSIKYEKIEQILRLYQDFEWINLKLFYFAMAK